MATDFTPQIDALYKAIDYNSNPSSSEVASFNSALQGGSLTLAGVQSAIINSPYTQNFVDPVIREYQAAFGRVPDQAGAAYWVGQVAANPNQLNVLSTTFANSAEFKTRYSASASDPTNPAVVTALYQNVLGRAGDAAGLSYWESQPLNVSQLLTAFAQSQEFIKDTANAVVAFQNLEVTGTEPTSGSLFNVSGGGQTANGSTFNLKGDNTDVFTLNSADPTHKTTNSGDTFFLNTPAPTQTVIQDGTGPNTLTITGLGAGVTYSPTQISGVQTINLSKAAANSTFDATNVTGLSTINDTTPLNVLVNITHLASNVTVGIGGETSNHATEVQFVAGTATASYAVGADAGKGDTVFVDTTTASGPNVSTENLVTSGTNIVEDGFFNPNTNLSAINIQGTGNLTLVVNSKDTGLTTINDTSTGNESLGANFASTGTVTVGNGADQLFIGSAPGKALSITAGNGADAISIQANAAHQISVGTGPDTFTVQETSAQLTTVNVKSASALDAAAVSITGFGSNSADILSLANTAGGPSKHVSLNGTQLANVAAAADLVAAATLAHQDAGNAANQVVGFNFGGNTYVEDFTQAGGPNANDTLVKLVGVSSELSIDGNIKIAS